MSGDNGTGVPTRVLVCDDAPSVRALVRELVALEPDLEVVGEVVNGREAIDAAERLRPDVVVLDVVMPVLGGLQALPAVVEAAPDAGVVMFSSLDDPALEALAMERGATVWLRKSAEPEEIVATIREASSRRRESPSR